MNDRDKQWQMGYKIASRRSALGLSQEALAEAVGISRVSIVRIENGDQLPKGPPGQVLRSGRGRYP